MFVKMFTATALAVTVAWSGAVAAELGKTFDEIVERARQEGKLSVWSALPGADAYEAMTDAFNARFGLDTKIEYVALGSPAANARAITEAAGNALTGDIIGATSFQELKAIDDAGLVEEFPWVEVFGDAYPNMQEIVDLIVPEYKGKGLPHFQAHYVISWNPNFIDDADVPSNLAEMTDPKWNGKFALNAFFLDPVAIVSIGMGEQETIDLGGKLLDNNPVLLKGSPPINQAIVTGQVQFGTDLSMTAERAIRAGQPLKFKMMEDFIPVTETTMYVLKGAPNPNTAYLFAAWLAGEGYKVVDKVQPFPNAFDPDNAFRKMAEEQEAASGAKVVKIQSLADSERVGRVREAFSLKMSGQN